MICLEVQTVIAATPQVCFDLAVDLEAHVKSAAQTGEKVVHTTACGLLGLGDTVSFEGRHFGLRLRMTVKVTEFGRPHRFVDEMVSGPFRRLWHEHRFEAVDEGTRMTDLMEVTAPLWVLGWIAERLFLARHLRGFLVERGIWLKEEAERRATHAPPG